MKNFVNNFLVLLIFIFCVTITFAQPVPTLIDIKDVGTNETDFTVGVQFDSDNPGPVTVDNSTLVFFIPAGATGATVVGQNGITWDATVTPNSSLSAVCPVAGTEWAMLAISSNGQANLGDVTANVTEDLAVVTLMGTGLTNVDITPYDPTLPAGSLSQCVNGFGVKSTMDVDPDGNSGAAITIGYEDIPGSAPINLPIRLRDFTATKLNDRAAKLAWSTQTEENGSHFEIERSLDGHDWSFIGRVKAVGESSQLQNYSYVDAKLPLDGRSEKPFFYRLKMVDKDGTFEYSGTRRVVFDALGGSLIVYPNPARGEVFVAMPDITPDRGIADLTIMNAQGKLIRKMKLMTNDDYRVDMSGFDAGVYYFHATFNGNTYTQKVVTIK